MDGALLSATGAPFKTFPTATASNGDIFKLDDILLSAPVELKTNLTFQGQEYSLRDVGLIFLIDVHYRSITIREPFEYKYAYNVTRIASPSGYKVTEIRQSDYNARTKLERHGVKIFFIFTGAHSSHALMMLSHSRD